MEPKEYLLVAQLEKLVLVFSIPDGAPQVTIKVKSLEKFAGRPGMALQVTSNLQAEITFAAFNYVGSRHALGSQPGP